MEIPVFIQRTSINNNTIIPQNIIQTYKTNKIHPFIYENIMKMIYTNSDFNYYFITDEIGESLIKEFFNEKTLVAFQQLNTGAAKGDFLRYIAMYVYGGIYLDLDSSIEIEISSIIDLNTEYIFFLDGSPNIQQWCFMMAPGHYLVLRIIEEMVNRILNVRELNIFLATGPLLVTDVIFNFVENTNYYNVADIIDKMDRFNIFINKHENNDKTKGKIIFEENPSIKKMFLFRMNGYNEEMLYNNNQKYIPTYNSPTPHLYK